MTAWAAAVLAVLTAANLALLSSVGWSGGCDEAIYPPELAGPETLTSVYCHHYAGFQGTISLQEWGTGFGPSLLFLVGSGLTILLRKRRGLVIAGVLALAWALWGWLPPIVDLIG